MKFMDCSVLFVHGNHLTKNLNQKLKNNIGDNYIIMGNNIKQKESIDEESSMESEVYCRPIGKSRKQELEDRRRERDFASVADIKPLLDKYAGTSSLVDSVEHQPSGDVQTTSSEELKKEKERGKYTNRQSGNHYYVR
jgi:hypothetical protein